MTTLKVQDVVDSSAAFDAWRADLGFAEIDAHPVYGAFGRRYYPAVFGGSRTDASFAVLDRQSPVLFVACTAGADTLDNYGSPVRFFLSAKLNEQDGAAAIETAFEHIDEIVKRAQLNSVAVADHSSLGVLSPLGKQCLNRGAAAVVRLNGWCDLRAGEAGLKRALRKSFGSLVNWGRRNLKMDLVTRDNPDRALFDRYRDFHAEVAGRVTREQASWDAMFDWVAAGRGELVLGSSDGELVAGTLIVDGSATAYYASGVYDRERFEKPMAHWPLWLAMLRSAERGLSLFDLGDLPLPNHGSAKEIAIGYFKRGFAGSIATSLTWRWQVGANRQDNQDDHGRA
jgi:hypothetical protein